MVFSFILSWVPAAEFLVESSFGVWSKQNHFFLEGLLMLRPLTPCAVALMKRSRANFFFQQFPDALLIAIPFLNRVLVFVTNGFLLFRHFLKTTGFPKVWSFIRIYGLYFLSELLSYYTMNDFSLTFLFKFFHFSGASLFMFFLFSLHASINKLLHSLSFS